MENNTKGKAHILVIEDDASINEVVTTFLTDKGFSCIQAFSGSEARLLLTGSCEESAGEAKMHEYDLIITDLMLPGFSGQELVGLIRGSHAVPIIVTSALDTPQQKIDLFDLGVDDYLVKPFDLDELYARVLVQLRHQKRLHSSASDYVDASADTSLNEVQPLVHGDWVLKLREREFEVCGDPVKLTRLEFNIIESLMRHPSKAYTKQELFELAWNEECYVEEKAVNVHISNIRAKLKQSGTDDYIQTVWGIGFKLAAL